MGSGLGLALFSRPDPVPVPCPVPDVFPVKVPPVSMRMLQTGHRASSVIEANSRRDEVRLPCKDDKIYMRLWMDRRNGKATVRK